MHVSNRHPQDPQYWCALVRLKGNMRRTVWILQLLSAISGYFQVRSGYSYGTRMATCICYSYGSQKISWDFSVIPDSRLSKLLYLPLEGLSESSECPFFEPVKFAYSLLTKRTTHSQHLFCAILTHTRHAIRRERIATGICYLFGIPMSISKSLTFYERKYLTLRNSDN